MCTCTFTVYWNCTQALPTSVQCTHIRVIIYLRELIAVDDDYCLHPAKTPCTHILHYIRCGCLNTFSSCITWMYMYACTHEYVTYIIEFDSSLHLVYMDNVNIICYA